jgi:hypothetical protein
VSRRQVLSPLAASAFAATLVVTRFGLIVHELVGHGGPAIALGGQISDLKLFWFAGGRIAYARAEAWTEAEAIAVQLGGIVLELLVAVALVAIARRDRRPGPSLRRVVIQGAAAGFAGHAGIYLATGVFYGLGDGTVLHRALGDWRPLVWAPAAALCVAIAYSGAVAVISGLRAYAPAATARGQLAIVAIALALAGAVMIGLVQGEMAVRADPTYAALMRTEGQRAVEREVARATASGADAAQLEAARRAAEDRHRPFPFRLVLVAAMAVAAMAGAARSRPAVEPIALSWRAFRPLGLLALAGFGLCVLIDLIA